MSRFTSTKVINSRWRNNDFIGAAGSSHTFPDQFHDEFLVDWAQQIADGSIVITETPTTGNIQMASLTVGDIVLTGTATGFPSAPTILGTTPINVVTASGTSTVSLNANYSTTSHLHDGTYQPFGTYVTSVSGTAPITASGTTAVTVGIDQTALTVAASTNAEVLRLYVKNSTGTTLNKGQPVYISSSDGNNAEISLASATNDATSSKTLGLLAQTLLTGEHGYVIENGLLAGIDTSTATAGQAVWLSATAGQLVYGTPPAEPAHGVYLGVVTRVQSVNGAIAVKVQNGYEIDELHDVSAGSPSDADIIQYRTSSGLWTKSSLVNSATSTSTTSVPTANAVRIANNAATAAQSTADLKLAKAGDTLTGTLTVSNTGSLAVFGATSTANTQVTTRVDGDASTRWGVRADGFQAWGDGTASRDTNLYRSAANTLATDDNFDVGLNLTVGGDIEHASQLDFIAGGAVGASVIASGLYLPPGKTLMFEGSTNNTAEIQLTAEDATADRTITLPDLTGTLAIGQTVLTSSSPVFAGLTVNGDITATSMPIRMASGTYSMSATSAANGNTTVTFPSGRFSVAPNVTITVASGPAGTGKVVPRHIGVSTTSFTGYWYTGDATTTTFTSCAFQYIAIQMTSSSASG